MPGANPEFEEMEFRISAVSGAENWAYWPLTEGEFLDESFMRSKKNVILLTFRHGGSLKA